MLVKFILWTKSDGCFWNDGIFFNHSCSKIKQTNKTKTKTKKPGEDAA